MREYDVQMSGYDDNENHIHKYKTWFRELSYDATCPTTYIKTSYRSAKTRSCEVVLKPEMITNPEL